MNAAFEKSATGLTQEKYALWEWEYDLLANRVSYNNKPVQCTPYVSACLGRLIMDTPNPLTTDRIQIIAKAVADLKGFSYRNIKMMQRDIIGTVRNIRKINELDATSVKLNNDGSFNLSPNDLSQLAPEQMAHLKISAYKNVSASPITKTVWVDGIATDRLFEGRQLHALTFFLKEENRHRKITAEERRSLGLTFSPETAFKMLDTLQTITNDDNIGIYASPNGSLMFHACITGKDRTNDRQQSTPKQRRSTGPKTNDSRIGKRPTLPYVGDILLPPQVD